MDEQIYNEPSKVSAEEGVVIVDGPDGIAVSLTPDAALETGGRLIDGAAEARGQQIIADKRKQESNAP